jgi:hypothetical protein
MRIETPAEKSVSQPSKRCAHGLEQIEPVTPVTWIVHYANENGAQENPEFSMRRALRGSHKLVCF